MILVATGATLVSLSSSAAGTTSTTNALLDHYRDSTGDYTSRVKPLVDALIAIEQPWIDAAQKPVTTFVIGKAIQPDGDVTIDQSAAGLGWCHVTNEPFRTLLRKAINQTVTVFGVEKASTVPIWKNEVEVQYILSIVSADSVLYKDAPNAYPANPGPSVAKGTVVNVYSQAGALYFVQLPDGTRGWLKAEALALGQPAPKPAAAAAAPNAGIAPSIGGAQK
jgi:hypothetical protein